MERKEEPFMSGVGVRIQQYGRIVSIIVATLSILAAAIN